ncbi:MAG: strictosidine synthase [Deltaproteobacteria bacterium HGW-Deltaproteobacteria-13]|nr:MAG: strictosidine synthase [Deltaproteobacteria bacterium HGW-Deltaproteobacteria-13]
MKKVFGAVVFILLLLVAYLTLWPVPIKPVQWIPPVSPGYTGPHAVNTKLTDLKIISLGAEEGPEQIAVGKDGKLYTTVASRKILRMNQDGSQQEVFAITGGRVLGFDFDAQGNIIAADVDNGLVSVTPDKRITVLTHQVNGDPIRYADAVVVAKSGKIYFSDASTRFAPKDWGGTFQASILDILEQRSTGRILEYDPATRITRIVAKGFSFANGIALSNDETWLFVNETGKYRIWKISVNLKDLDISHPSMSAVVFLENLPGYPDNLMRGLDGKIWLGFAKPRNPVIDKMTLTSTPFMRKLIMRLPRFMWPVPKPYGHVMAFTEDGKVVADLQDPSGTYPETTGVTETTGRLYIQSLHARGIGWLAK